MTARRAIPTSLAGVLRELELDRPTVVTTDLAESLRRRLGLMTDAAEIVRRLRRLGWLLPLRVRGAWEFAPADRAGPLPGGDPFIELRALNLTHPHLRVGVGYESAAFLRSLASRQPQREVLIFDEGAPVIRAMSEFRRVELTLPEVAYESLSGLRVQTPAGLLTALAIRPDGFRDWPGLAEWLGNAAEQADIAPLREMLTGRPAAAWSRASYLLRRGGNESVAEVLLRSRPAGQGPFYLGPRRGGGRFDARTQVLDTVLHRYSTSGQET